MNDTNSHFSNLSNEESTSIAYEMLKKGQKLQHEVELGPQEAITCEKFCAGSNLHRGYFHPSPVFDLIVGGLKRGRLLKKAGKQTSFFRYLYTNDTLSYIESYYQGRIACREKLFYRENIRIGVTVDLYNHLSAVSEECYENGQLSYFILAHFSHIDEADSCYHLQVETYTYDAVGVKESTYLMHSPVNGVIFQDRYLFEREDGFLTGYTNLTSPKKDAYRFLTKRECMPTDFWQQIHFQSL